MENKDQLRWVMWYAAVQRHFPDKSLEELLQGYGRWKQQKADFAQYAGRLTIKMLSEACVLPAELPKQGILLSFHYGPYRLLPKILLAAGYKVALLASAKVLEREKSGYSRQLEQEGWEPQAMRCLDADDPTIFKKMLRAIQQEGRIVLVYLDADEGYAHKDEEIAENYIKLQLGEAPLYWRCNLLKLAYRFRIPIGITAMDEWEKERCSCKTRLLQTGGYSHEHDFIEAAKWELQQMLLWMMERDWTAWENWTLLHRYQKMKNVQTGLPVAVPTTMIPIYINKRPFLFHPATVQFLQVLK